MYILLFYLNFFRICLNLFNVNNYSLILINNIRELINFDLKIYNNYIFLLNKKCTNKNLLKIKFLINYNYN